jgi:hypothetical protein
MLKTSSPSTRVFAPTPSHFHARKVAVEETLISGTSDVLSKTKII